MDERDILQRIHWNDNAEEELDLYDYAELKEHTINYFNRFKKQGCSIQGCVNGVFYYHYEEEFEANGMEKLACMVLGLLFEIEHGEVDPDLAYSTAWDIRDFETGSYDDLFSIEDLTGIKADIAEAKKYLLQHPELTDDIILKP